MPKRFHAALVHPDVAILGVWLALGVVYGAATYRIADWFKLPDELVFQRLGVSIGRDHSLLPRIHGEFIRSLNQLYPLLISPIVAGGYVADDLPQIRLLNAFVATSACIPAYLLARRVSARRSVGYLIGVLSVALPWMVLTPFLLTEVVALPAFLWAMLAFQRALVAPSTRNDLLALGSIVLAVLARTQFVVLAGVLPAALVAFALRRGGIRSLWTVHRPLVVLYAALGTAATVFQLAGGRLLSLSIYGEQFGRGITPRGVPGWALGHAADLAFTLGLLPFLVGGAWLLANLARPAASEELQAFAAVGATTVVLLIYGVTTFDLQLGGFIFDRYLFYLGPVVLLGFACALLDARRPRWSLLVPTGVVAAGFLLHLQQEFAWHDDQLNSDSPPAVLYEPIVNAFGSRHAAAIALAAGAAVLAGLFCAVARLPRVTAVLLTALAIAIPAETGYLFHRLLGTEGYSSRPLTHSNAGVLDWVDRTVGPNARVTIVPYPVAADILVTERYWRDLEFWNKSVARQIVFPRAAYFSYTGYWFPKTVPAFGRESGSSSSSRTRYALQSVGETRFRFAGTVIQQTQEAMLIDVVQPWRLAWRTFGLYEDGWTKPHTRARVRIYASAGQTAPTTRYLTLQLRAPGGAPRLVVAASNLQRREQSVAPGQSDLVGNLLVCVPARGYADVTLETPAVSEIPGGQVDIADSETRRQGGVLVSGIAVAGETAGPCSP